MDTGIYWQVFEKTGSLEAFLAYFTTEEIVSDSSVDSDIIDSKSCEGEE